MSGFVVALYAMKAVLLVLQATFIGLVQGPLLMMWAPEVGLAFKDFCLALIVFGRYRLPYPFLVVRLV